MNRLWIVAILTLVLAGCGGSAAPSGGQCNQGLCVKIEMAEPIRWGEPIVVTVTVTAEKDISNLQVSLTSYPPVFIEDQGEWVEEGTRTNVNITTNRPLVIVRKVLLLTEGMFELVAGVYTPNLPYVSDSVRIYLTRNGGKVYYEGTPLPTSVLSGIALGNCSPGPCLTIRVVEPVIWGEPVRVILQVDGKKEPSMFSFATGDVVFPTDFPNLGLVLASTDPAVQIKAEKGEFRDLMTWPAGNGVWWVADIWANSTQEYTFWVTFPAEKGLYQLSASAYDLALGIVSADFVVVEVGSEGGKVFAPSLGTPLPTVTPWSTLFPTSTPDLSSLKRSPTPAQEAYPQPESPDRLPMPTPPAYP